MVLSLGTSLPAHATSKPVMVGYFPAFKGLARIATTPIDHYTHINLAFANPDANGLLARDGAMTCMSGGAAGNVSLTELRDAVAKLRRKGAKVLLSVAGGVIPGCSGDWSALLRPDKRETVKRELLAIVDAAGLEGIDIDIEGALLTAIDREGNYTPFIAMLSADLKAKGKLLTVATASYEGGMIPRSSVRYFDLVMPMSYDAIGPSWGQAGSEHSTEAQAARDIALWLDRGVPRERLVLGVPFYGYGFGKYAPGYDFRTLLATFGKAVLNADLIGNACAGCDYVTFNAPETLRRKSALAKARAGGVMVWEMTQDTDDQQLGSVISGVLYASSN
ncbi:glycosyl hydrolase family 18 protein [Sphingomonas sp. G-3-2-10]|uniref:glycosyl hydrolase family 18 protein n=1 Tax=Sphingomonas sp. G-3-2-10 TaxID=2728838 RepID=UPI00146A8D73|nr:glycosyl hydrolase family 18 protein [Sphingomonas sp. G-3-2-10]NML07851.1 glycosyl hydrolase family 18 [Sphingomonas sp. G-3-2-10]